MTIAAGQTASAADILLEHASDGQHKIKSGLNASKAASPTVGMMYYATDTTTLYVCFSAGSWTTIDHTKVLNIGTNTHAQIDTHIAATVAHGMLASIPLMGYKNHASAYIQSVLTSAGTTITVTWPQAFATDLLAVIATPKDADPGQWYVNNWSFSGCTVNCTNACAFSVIAIGY